MTKDEIFLQLLSYDWPSAEKLVVYAKSRHGFCGDDGAYGVTYPSDRDEYQRDVEGAFIAEGYVEIGYWHDGCRDLTVRESDYLLALRDYLIAQGRDQLASELESG